MGPLIQARPRVTRSASVAAFLSFLWPGLGQLYTGRRAAAIVFALPTALVVGYVLLEVARDPLRAAAVLFVPSVALTVLVLTVVLGLWRLVSVLDAHLGVSTHDPATRRRVPVVLAFLAVVVISTHALGAYYAWSFYESGSQIFVADTERGSDPAPRPRRSPAPSGGGVVGTESPKPEPEPEPEPEPDPVPDFARDRMNVVLTGLDNAPGHQASLTDTLLVVSFDPTTKQVAMVSFPRDIANFRLSNGDNYPDKINTFYRHALGEEGNHHRAMSAVARELGHLLGIRIRYYASIQYDGFEELIDALGGVEVDVERDIVDPGYGWGPGNPKGFFLKAGRHRLDGRLALAFARSRKGVGDSDFTRAERQQQLLFAVRRKLTDPAMLPRLPDILRRVAKTVKTNFPAEHFATVLALAREVKESGTKRYVLGPPYSRHPPSRTTGGLWTLKLRMDRVAKLSVELFGKDSRYAESGTANPP